MDSPITTSNSAYPYPKTKRTLQKGAKGQQGAEYGAGGLEMVSSGHDKAVASINIQLWLLEQIKPVSIPTQMEEEL